MDEMEKTVDNEEIAEEVAVAENKEQTVEETAVSHQEKTEEEIVADKIYFPDVSFKISARRSKRVPYTGKAFHEEIEIKYCYEGRFNVLINTCVYTVEEGDIIVVNPYEVHENIKIEGEVPAQYYSLLCDLDTLNDLNLGVDLRQLLVADGKKFTNVIKNDERLRTVIRLISEEMEEKKEFHRVVEKGLLGQIIALLLRDYLKDDIGLIKEDIKLKQSIVPAMLLIHNQYANKITVEALAKACNISVSSFCRFFKAHMGTTPIQYLMSYRIRLADMLLKSTTKTCEEIAIMCGFEEATYFNKCYKKLCGISPNRARRRNKQSPKA